MALLALLLLGGCGSWVFHPVDPIAQSRGKLDKTPRVYVWLGQAQQICAGLPGSQETVRVDIFVRLLNLPPQPFHIIINERPELTIRFSGDNAHLSLKKVGLGQHKAEVYVPGYREEPFVISWSVWNCPPPEKGELYKPDGSGLKGYCPPECCGGGSSTTPE